MFDPRAYRRGDDDAAIVALFARLHPSDTSMSVTSIERWREFCGIAYVSDGRDFQVVEVDKRVVALLTAFKLDDVRRVRIIVDPEFRRCGIADALLRIGEAQARAEGSKALESFINGTSASSLAFAKARGFEVHVHDLFLVRPPTPLLAPMPAGIHLRPYVGEVDDEAWAALANATLVRDIGFHPETTASLQSYTRARGFALWFAEAHELRKLIGFCHVEAREKDGFVQALGVLGEWEGRGVGAALLARGIETLCRPGVTRIELCTERNNDRARRLYSRAGFTTDREAFTMRRALVAI